MNQKLYVIYDGSKHVDDAVCYETCKTLEEAKKNAPNYSEPWVIYSYDVGRNGHTLRNEKLESYSLPF